MRFRLESSSHLTGLLDGPKGFGKHQWRQSVLVEDHGCSGLPGVLDDLGNEGVCVNDDPQALQKIPLAEALEQFNAANFGQHQVQKEGIGSEFDQALDTAGDPRLVGYIVARPFTSLERLGNNTLGIAITLLLTGFFLMFNRRKAITQVLALLTIENGVMLAAVALTTYGMPLVVELGIFFDVMVAVMVLGILVYRIRENFASMDVGKLSQLKG